MRRMTKIAFAAAAMALLAIGLLGCGSGGSSAIGKYVTIDGAYWRNAFENPDYSDFADDEERELFVIYTVSPAESQKLQVGGAGRSSADAFVGLVAGNQEKSDSFYMNYTNSYYQPIRDAGYSASPFGVIIEPPDSPKTFVAEFFVKGWEVKGMDHVTLKVKNLFLDGKTMTGEFKIPLDSIVPVIVESDGQPTHTAMIEKMVEMVRG